MNGYITETIYACFRSWKDPRFIVADRQYYKKQDLINDVIKFFKADPGTQRHMDQSQEEKDRFRKKYDPSARLPSDKDYDNYDKVD